MIAIHHVQISVPVGRLEDAINFYTEVMDFKFIERPESLQKIEGCWLGVNGLQVHIRTRENHPKNSKEHVAYQVDDLKEWRDKLESSGFKTTPSIPIPGVDRFEFRDPFDNRIEMMCFHNV
jgi:catechol 2,3-dioxygenase-like lactoylglutathione lyase family enzyme